MDHWDCGCIFWTRTLPQIESSQGSIRGNTLLDNSPELLGFKLLSYIYSSLIMFSILT